MFFFNVTRIIFTFAYLIYLSIIYCYMCYRCIQTIRCDCKFGTFTCSRSRKRSQKIPKSCWSTTDRYTKKITFSLWPHLCIISSEVRPKRKGKKRNLFIGRAHNEAKNYLILLFLLRLHYVMPASVGVVCRNF